MIFVIFYDTMCVICSGLAQDFDMQVQGVFKEYARTNKKFFKEFQINIHSACANSQTAQNTENETFLGLSHVFLYDFLQTFFWLSLQIIFSVVCCCERIKQ